MSFTEVFGDWLQSAVTTELYLGAGFEGESYGPPIPVEGVFLDDTRRLVRSSEGNEVVSSSTVYVPAEHAGRFLLHSRVTLPDGRRAKVLQVATQQVEGWDFRVVNLT